MRSANSVFAVMTVAMLAGCANEAGEAWGTASFDVEASFEGPVALSSGGQLEEVEVSAHEVALLVEAASGEAAGHDHEHDHGGEGEEGDEEAELWIVSQALSDAPVTLTDGAEEFALGECADDCRLPLGDVVGVELEVETMVLRGTNGDGEPFEIALELEEFAATSVDAHVEGQVGEVGVTVELRLESEFFEGLDESDPAAADALVRGRLADAIEADIDLEGGHDHEDEHDEHAGEEDEH